jgi:hypothetical protein
MALYTTGFYLSLSSILYLGIILLRLGFCVSYSQETYYGTFFLFKLMFGGINFFGYLTMMLKYD